MGLFAWRWAVMSEAGPDNPLSKLVCMALSLHMKDHGAGAFPTQASLAKASGMGLRSVKRHLEALERNGWVQRVKVRDPGKTWAKTLYTAVVPDRFKVSEQGATVALSSLSDAVAQPNKVPPVHSKVPTTTEQGATGDNNKVPSFGLLTLNPNSKSNSKENSKGALTRVGEPKRFGEKESKEVGGEENKASAIEKAVASGLSDGAVAQILKQRGVTPDDVAQVRRRMTN